jgi:tetratricopeptide (TPR) repeat protein/predicted Ser/Thr protein kinase
VANCLADDEIAAFVEGRMGAPGRQHAVDHISSCEYCRAIVAASRITAPVETGDDERRNALEPGEQVGRFVIRRLMGKGGMGAVYSAHDPELDRAVAVKVLRPDLSLDNAALRARLQREAQALARLAHPNVVAVYDVGTSADGLFIAMELVEGETLRHWLSSPRGWRETVAMFVSAGNGLEAAHRAGLVHRDFKPENVLIGSDGRARVTDFGLARLDNASLDDDDDDKPPSPLSLTMTRTGALLGTPAYMAPEQLRRESTDARSDIFSFSVALWEALYGTRPFAGDSMEGQLDAIVAGRLRPTAPGRKVPSWLKPILRRGLMADPAARFATMAELLAALTRDRTAGLRRALLIAAPLVTLIVLGLGYRRIERATACSSAAPRLAGIWDDGRRNAMSKAFAATGKPYAADLFRAVSQILDDYARGWVAMHQEACEATRVRGDQSQELLDLRMECLANGLQQLRATTDLMVTADANIVDRALTGARSIPPLSICADRAALQAPMRPPRDRAMQARVESLRGELAQANALRWAGKYAESIKHDESVIAAAREMHYRPLEAEALAQKAYGQVDGGDYKGARPTLLETIDAAMAGRHEVIEVSGWIVLGWQSYFSSRYAEGHELANHAAACIERLGGNHEQQELRLERLRGSLLTADRNFGAAREHLQRALVLSEKQFGPDGIEVANMLSNLAEVLDWQGELAPARSYLERALRIREKAFGSSNPEVGKSLNNLGCVAESQGDHQEALQLFQRALAVYSAAGLPPENPNAAETISNIGTAYERLNRYDEALAQQLRGVKLQEKIYGPESPQAASRCNDVAATLLALHRPDEAQRYAERALAVVRKSLGADHADTVEPLRLIGRAQLERHEPAAALRVLEQALVVAEKHPDIPWTLAKTRLAVALALWATGGDGARARQLALKAKEVYAANSRRFARELAEAEGELAKH